MQSALLTRKADSLVALREVLGARNVGISAKEKLTRGSKAERPAKVIISGFVD